MMETENDTLQDLKILSDMITEQETMHSKFKVSIWAKLTYERGDGEYDTEKENTLLDPVHNDHMRRMTVLADRVLEIINGQ